MLARTLSGVGECAIAHTVDDALRRLAEGGWEAAVVDFDLGDEGTGFAVLHELRLLSERTARYLYTSYHHRGFALEAVRTAHAHGVFDARREDFFAQVHAEVSSRLAAPAPAVPQADVSGDPRDAWCAMAPATQALLEELRRAADEDAVTFVYGETGAGKRLAAETLRRARARLGRPGADPRGAGDGRPVRVVHVPPLRERATDLPELATAFLEEHAAASGSAAARLEPEALTALGRRDWWGNVRELRAALARARLRAARRGTIGAADLPRDAVPAPSGLQRARDEATRDGLLLMLRSAGSVRAAASLAGLPRANFRRLMKRHGILRADVAVEPE